MRAQKFRGMDANSIMRYGRLSQDQENSTRYYKEYSQRICWNVGAAQHNIPVSNKTLGQGIGLKDKNGVGIYEGDRIQTVLSDGTRLSTFIIEWDADYARFVMIREQDNDRFFLTAGLSINKEVIGNIHEQESHT